VGGGGKPPNGAGLTALVGLPGCAVAGAGGAGYTTEAACGVGMPAFDGVPGSLPNSDCIRLSMNGELGSGAVGMLHLFLWHTHIGFGCTQIGCDCLRGIAGTN